MTRRSLGIGAALSSKACTGSQKTQSVGSSARARARTRDRDRDRDQDRARARARYGSEATEGSDAGEATEGSNVGSKEAQSIYAGSEEAQGAGVAGARAHFRAFTWLRARACARARARTRN